MSDKIRELFAIPTDSEHTDWQAVLEQQHCPFLDRKCVKTRKSQPDIAIGTCSVNYGTRENTDIIICPHRFLSRGQIFIDCIHLLTLHEPGNELHRIPEIAVPGGSVDYVLASVKDGKVVDFVGIELQAVDTTGTVWPARQEFLSRINLFDDKAAPSKTYGMNWKMTAKTTLVQMHHKIGTFEGLGKHLVLVMQDVLMRYMRRAFNFVHIQDAKIGHAMHFHAYGFEKHPNGFQLKLSSRASTDAAGMSTALGLQARADIALEAMVAALESKISEATALRI